MISFFHMNMLSVFLFRVEEEIIMNMLSVFLFRVEEEIISMNQ